MAEQHLRKLNVPESEWNMMRFRYSENLEDSMWASVIVEIERRGSRWIVTRLDRNRQPVEEVGFRSL